MKPYFVYMLRCRDGSLYTGSTRDLARRMAAHQAGRGAKYTRARGPVQLVYWEEAADKGQALSREYALKQLSKAAKEELVKSAAALDKAGESCDNSRQA